MITTVKDRLNFSLGSGTDLELVRVRAGRFIMGSESEVAFGYEKPEHIVRITEDFYIGKYPITQRQWKSVMSGNNPSRFIGDDRPVEQVSWLRIVKDSYEYPERVGFLSALNDLKLATKVNGILYTFRLPTEAEWEYAAKGGHRGPQNFTADEKARELYTTYAGSDKLKEVGWFKNNSHWETKPVGIKRPNELGLFDMSGNVREWCTDWFLPYRKFIHAGEIVNPTGPNDGASRIIKGGAWGTTERYCQTAYRGNFHSSQTDIGTGFRVVLAPVTKL